MAAAPGSEFYHERVQRVQALPEAQRGADVQAWLTSDAVLEAAAMALPEIRTGAPLEDPTGGKPALAALLRVLAHSFCHPPSDPMHPVATLRRLGPQLPPLMRVWLQGTQVQMQPTELLANLIHLPPGAAEELELDLDMVARLLLLALVSCWQGVEQISMGVQALQVVKPTLCGAAGAAGVTRQLARLQQQVGSGAGAREAPLPTAEELQVVWHMLLFELVVHEAAPAHLPPTRIASAATEAARGLLQLQPGKPRSSFDMGKVAVMNHSLNPGSALRDPLPHLLRCAELARQQRSSFFLSRACWWAAMVAASDSSPAVSPAQAAALLEEGDAAQRRCKRVVPHAWTKIMEAEREMCSAMRDTIAASVARSPDRWQAEVRRKGQAEVNRRAQEALAKQEAGLPKCDGCGLPSVALRRCTGCREVSYCSTECQKAAWRAHKVACKAAAARAAAAAAGG